MITFSDVDSPSYDIMRIPNATPEQLFEYCKWIPLATAFNSAGFIKYFSPRANLKHEPGCTFYQLPQEPITLLVPKNSIEILCTATRDDIVEYVKIHFDQHKFITGNFLDHILQDPRDDFPVVVLTNDVEAMTTDFVHKLGHVIELANNEYDVIILSNTERIFDDIPKVIPVVVEGSENPSCFVITKAAAKKIKARQPVQNWSCVPHLIRQ